MKTTTPALKAAFDKLGIQGVADACKVSYHAAYKWSGAGRLPRTEWTGETQHAGNIVLAMAKAGHKLKRDELLVLVEEGAEVAPAPATSQTPLAFDEAKQ